MPDNRWRVKELEKGIHEESRGIKIVAGTEINTVGGGKEGYLDGRRDRGRDR